MRASPVLLTALAVAVAYYVYTPLPSTLSEPWKLMLLDATFRCVQDLVQQLSRLHWNNNWASQLIISHIIGVVCRKDGFAEHRYNGPETLWSNYTGQQNCNLAHYVGLSHHLHVLNFVSNYFDKLDPISTTNLKVTDTVFDGVEVRIYEPEDRTLKGSIIYIHGGGWALGSARTRSYDNLCRKISEDVNAVVVSIEYRLVPNVYFPEQINDVFAATKYFMQPEVLSRYSVDPHRIAISGDSSGGNLAAALCQQIAQDKNIKIKVKLQALIYPVLQILDFNTPSYQQNMDMPVLSRFVMIKFWLDYLNGSHHFAHAMLVNNHTSLDISEAVTLRELLNWNLLLPLSFKKNYKPVIQTVGTPSIVQEVPAVLDFRASPLIAHKETLKELPKTYMLTCEHDVLRDDGTMYVKRLEEAGVDVTHDHYEDCFHGCMIFSTWPTYFSAGVQTREGYIRWLSDNL